MKNVPNWLYNSVVAINVVSLLYSLAQLYQGISPVKNIWYFVAHAIVITMLVVARDWKSANINGLPSYFLRNREGNTDVAP